jgi:5'-nucleotidase
MIRWVFLDVGNILLDEDPLAYRCTRIHFDAAREVRPDLTFTAFLSMREARAVQGSRWPLYEAVSAILDEDGCSRAWGNAEREIRADYAGLAPVIAGAPELVERLSTRFQLGLIANQGPECRERLSALGLLRHFPIAILGEELGLAKPDARLFELALEHAGASPQECAMIGDRVDNDVVPAAALGLKTVWVRWPHRAAKGWRPDDPDAIVFRDSLERSQPRIEATPADLSVETISEINDRLWH